MKIKWFLILTITICFCLSGCFFIPNKQNSKNDASNVKTEGEKTLTQRQIDILKEQGLPTDYDQLSTLQKSAITTIEKFLVYLEDKYESSFKYVSYSLSFNGVPENLKATTDINGVECTVTAYRKYVDGEFVYSDNYDTFLAAPIYKKVMAAYFDTILEDTGYKLFTDVKEVNGKFDEENVLKNSTATTVLYITEAALKGESVDKKIEAFVNWIKGKNSKIVCTVQFCVIENDKLSEVYSFNYAELITADWVNMHKICTIDQEGNVNIV